MSSCVPQTSENFLAFMLRILMNPNQNGALIPNDVILPSPLSLRPQARPLIIIFKMTDLTLALER